MLEIQALYRMQCRRITRITAVLLLAYLILACADLATTNFILGHGGGELNPFMRLAQTSLGPWWLIPKLSLTFAVMLLLNRSRKPRHIAIAVGLFSTAVINNLIIIADMH